MDPQSAEGGDEGSASIEQYGATVTTGIMAGVVDSLVTTIKDGSKDADASFFLCDQGTCWR